MTAVTGITADRPVLPDRRWADLAGIVRRVPRWEAVSADIAAAASEAAVPAALAVEAASRAADAALAAVVPAAAAADAVSNGEDVRRGGFCAAFFIHESRDSVV